MRALHVVYTIVRAWIGLNTSVGIRRGPGLGSSLSIATFGMIMTLIMIAIEMMMGPSLVSGDYNMKRNPE